MSNMWRPWHTVENFNVENNLVPIVHEAEIPEEEVVENVDESFDDESGEPTARRLHLPPIAQQIILNVFLFIKSSEGESGAIGKTSRMTKIPQSTVRKLIVNGVYERKTRNDVGCSRTFKDHDADLVRRLIYDAYKNNIVLTIEELLKKVKTFLNINCCKDTLRNFLKKMDFHFKTINKRQVLMESPRISEWRVKYLNDIKKHREEGAFIIYLDETWYDTHDTVKKGWVDKSNKCVLNVPASQGKRVIILHAGSKNGWVEDALLLSAKDIKDSSVDYHDNMSAEIFENWFEYKLLPKLPPRTVIVLDNASYHSAQRKKIPNTTSRKEEIKEFLLENDLYFEESYTKKELLEVLRTKKFNKTYNVDSLAEERGHKVLRLPPYHCIFNPIEMIWAELKAHVRRKNISPKFSASTLNLIKEEISNITEVSWANCVRHVIKEEDFYREKLVAELIIDLGDESDDEIDVFNE